MKIGTSTVTENCSNSGDEKLQRRIKKDSETTSKEYGYKFTGYTFKNQKTGEVLHKHLKLPYLNYDQTKKALFQLFCANIEDFESGSNLDYNQKALDHCVLFVTNLKNFVSLIPYDIKGASILIVLDHTQR